MVFKSAGVCGEAVHDKKKKRKKERYKKKQRQKKGTGIKKLFMSVKLRLSCRTK